MLLFKNFLKKKQKDQDKKKSPAKMGKQTKFQNNNNNKKVIENWEWNKKLRKRVASSLPRSKREKLIKVKKTLSI